MKLYLGGLLAMLALVAAGNSSATTTAAATTRLVHVTSPVSPGAHATLTAHTSPANVTCSITVRYKSGPSHAAGLYPKQSSSAGRVSWTWKVGTRTTAGRWPITVACGKAGRLNTSFVVR